jgi:1,4-dihydroxy-2-naphthoate octaprenyltransferase
MTIDATYTESLTPVKAWALQVRAPFLLLAVLLVAIGSSASLFYGSFSPGLSVIALLGAVLAHAAVNLFNELSDYRTGIDDNTRRTPFSGGSGMMQRALTSEANVKKVAWACLLAALGLGILACTLSTWWLLAFIIPGGLAARFYTSHLARVTLGELAAGACLGSFVVLGTFLLQVGTLPPEIFLLSIPPGILTSLLLFLNEFPDCEADAQGGRRHLVILLGKRACSRLYAFSLLSIYPFVIACVAFRLFPVPTLLALLTLPISVKAARITLQHYNSHEHLVPALGANVGVVLGTDALLAVGYLIGAFLR